MLINECNYYIGQNDDQSTIFESIKFIDDMKKKCR